MIIEIDDSLSGKERQHLIKSQPVKYALEKFYYNQKKAAKWLGISEKGMHILIKRYPDLIEAIQKARQPKREHMGVEWFKGLPKTLEECKSTLMYRYASAEKKDKILDYYHHRRCLHEKCTTLVKKIDNELTPVKVCCECLKTVPGILDRDKNKLLKKLKNFKGDINGNSTSSNTSSKESSKKAGKESGKKGCKKSSKESGKKASKKSS